VLITFRHTELELAQAASLPSLRSRRPATSGGDPGEVSSLELPWSDRVATALGRLPPGAFTATARFERLPLSVGELTAEGRRLLIRAPEVLAIEPDAVVRVQDAQSDAVTRAPQARTQHKLSGKGVKVAVIDTGAELTHPDLAGAIIAQRCFTQGACAPNRANAGTNANDVFGHGTLVSSLILGRGAVAPLGVAPGAEMIALQALGPDGTGVKSDTLLAMDWVANNPSFGVKLINISISGGLFTGDCDDAFPGDRAAFTLLRMQGVSVFVAAGNSGSLNQLSHPACLSTAIAVGALGREPRTCNGVTGPVACFSDSAPNLDLLAPGDPILGAYLNGGTTALSGTSFASPTAAGVAALLLEQNSRMPPAELLALLRRTGKSVTDARNNVVTPAIDASAAADALQLTLCAGRADGSPCNDYDACSTVDTCVAGVCVGACDDGDRCTTGDRCSAGKCAGVPKSCPAATPCTSAAACVPATGECQAAPANEGGSCDDGDACTRVDACRAGACAGAALCASPQTCREGVCEGGPAVRPSRPSAVAVEGVGSCASAPGSMAVPALGWCLLWWRVRRRMRAWST
jgi:hypothetical protein